MSQPPKDAPTQSPKNVAKRIEIAKRIFYALCEKFPKKYIALVEPRQSLDEQG